ncbi:MAG: hypothetical protein AB8G99_05140, partial [Planctomycetaceae bacterium]
DGDSTTSITASSLTLSALDSIGSDAASLATNVDSLEAAAANLFVNEVDAITLSNVNVTDSATITNQTGDIEIGSVNAGDGLFLTIADGSVRGQGGTSITADRLSLDVSGSIGDAAGLTTAVSSLAASGSGDINISNTGGNLTIGSVGGISGITTDSGSIQLTQSEALRLNQSVTNSSSGNITLSANSMDLGADVAANGGGDIGLTSATSINVDGVVLTTGSGSITPVAMSGISFTDSGSFDTPTGIARNETPVLTDLSSPIITSAGIGEVSGTFGVTGEESFTLTVDWADGTIDTFVLNNPGSFNYEHQYLADATTNSVSELIITVTVSYNAALNGVESTTGTTAAQLPGEGIVTTVVSTAAAPPPDQVVELVAIEEVQELTSIVANNQEVQEFAVQVETVEAAETRVLLRVISETGETFEEIELDESVLDNLPKLFERLPDGRYSVSIQEAGDQRERLVMDLNVREGRAADSTEQAAANRPATAIGSVDAVNELPGQRQFQVMNSLGELETLGRDQLERFWQRWSELRALMNATDRVDAEEPGNCDVVSHDSVPDSNLSGAPEKTDEPVQSSNELWWATAAAGTAGAWLLARRLLRGTPQTDEEEIAADRARLESVLPAGPFDTSVQSEQQSETKETVTSR